MERLSMDHCKGNSTYIQGLVMAHILKGDCFVLVDGKQPPFNGEYVMTVTAGMVVRRITP